MPSAGSGKEIQHTDVVLRSVTSSLNATAVGSHVIDETAQTRVDAEDCLLIQQCALSSACNPSIDPEHHV